MLDVYDLVTTDLGDDPNVEGLTVAALKELIG